jgi:hypothetical protein
MGQKRHYKVVVAIALVLAIASCLWFVSPVEDTAPSTHCYAQGYGYGGGGISPPPLFITRTGSINLARYVDAGGRTIIEIHFVSNDGLVTLVIPKGTKVLDAEGNLMGIMEIIALSTPPPPEGYVLVGSAYDCQPDGATFEPEVTLTFTYDPADIPNGVSEEGLVLAYWDGDKWVMLLTTVDTEANTVTADVEHFTPFGILAKLPLAPAAFAVSTLTVSPATVDIGETVTISVLVTNTGGLTGSYEVTLKVDEVAVATQEVTVDGGASQEVTFTTTKDAAGTYAVDVNGLADTFVVRGAAVFRTTQLSISPAEVEIEEQITISAVVTNVGEAWDIYTVTLQINGVIEATEYVTLDAGQATTVTFTVVKDLPGIYEVEVSGLTGSFTVVEIPLPWWIWLIVGLVVAAAAGSIVWWQLRRAAMPT